MGKYNLKDLPNEFIILSYTYKFLKIDAMGGITNKYKTKYPQIVLETKINKL